jgi:hypothetical protein
MANVRGAISAIPLGLLALMCSSCQSRTDAPVYPVTGRLLVNGQPAERALVVFHPVAEDGGELPHADVAADGSFRLNAPAGDYLVTVEWWLSSGKRGDDSPPTNRLPAKYASVKSSGLTAHVGAGPTELQPFELTR